LEKLLNESQEENHGLKASYLSSTITKALAIFGGQWPHSSYAVPGGVTCDPTYVDVMQAENLLDEFIRFFEQTVIGLPIDKYLDITSVSSLNEIRGDFGRILKLMGINEMANIGYSYDRFIVFGESKLFQSGKSMATTVFNVDVTYAEESLQENTKAKDAKYKQKFYEVGPLARAMVAKEPIVKSLHKRYKDSTITRVFARIHEIVLLVMQNKQILQNLKLDEPSCVTITKKPLKNLNFEGVGIVEAARGSLIHRTRVEAETIKSYEIITPTQWNLSNGEGDTLGIAQKAMINLEDIAVAEFVFKSFDVCSVCTTK
jgi:Ni,Fe-hydrogenase I large subunit